MRLAILAEVLAGTIDHGRGVVVDPFVFDLVNRDDQRDAQFFCQRLHQVDRGSVRNRLGRVVPARALLGAEVGSVEDFLQADDLRAFAGCLADQAEVLVDHGLLDLGQRLLGGLHVGGLDERAANNARHGSDPFCKMKNRCPGNARNRSKTAKIEPGDHQSTRIGLACHGFRTPNDHGTTRLQARLSCGEIGLLYF